MLLHAAGSAPLRLLAYKSRFCKLDMLDHDAGSVLLKLLAANSRSLRLDKFDHTAGSVPLRLLAYKLRCCKLDILDHDAGSTPMSLFEFNTTFVTSPEASHIMPCQSVPHGVRVPHPALFFHSGPLVALYNSMRRS